jgi:hypothetical protein
MPILDIQLTQHPTILATTIAAIEIREIQYSGQII